MLTVDDSDFTPDHIELLEEWADNLGISVEVLLARIVLAASEGERRRLPASNTRDGQLFSSLRSLARCRASERNASSPTR